MQREFCNGNDKTYQSRLNELLKKVFFDFSFWYDLNLWDENYESYAFSDNGRIVSNICVYKAQIVFRGKPCRALSLGAVATDPEYRGRGLARGLMEGITAKYADTPMYLSANDGVVDFYPRFGFRRVYEKQPFCDRRIDRGCAPRRLSVNDPKIWRHLEGRVSFSKQLDLLNSAPIGMFHIHLGYLTDHIYEIPELQTMLIAEQQGEILKIHGVFSLQDLSFAQLAALLPFSGVKKIQFCFTPPWADLDYYFVEQTTDPLFFRGPSCELGDFKFPELSLT